jgi:hypothetical protein
MSAFLRWLGDRPLQPARCADGQVAAVGPPGTGPWVLFARGPCADTGDLAAVGPAELPPIPDNPNLQGLRLEARWLSGAKWPAAKVAAAVQEARDLAPAVPMVGRGATVYSNGPGAPHDAVVPAPFREVLSWPYYAALVVEASKAPGPYFSPVQDMLEGRAVTHRPPKPAPVHLDHVTRALYWAGAAGRTDVELQAWAQAVLDLYTMAGLVACDTRSYAPRVPKRRRPGTEDAHF